MTHWAWRNMVSQLRQAMRGQFRTPRSRRELLGYAAGLAVAERALCLRGMIFRAHAEHALDPESGVQRTEIEYRSDIAVQCVQWLKQQGVWETASVRERALFEKPLGSWHRDEILEGSWRAESLGVLLWALESIKDLPPYDHEADDPSIEQLADPHQAQALLANAKTGTLETGTTFPQVRDVGRWAAEKVHVRIRAKEMCA